MGRLVIHGAEYRLGLGEAIERFSVYPSRKARSAFVRECVRSQITLGGARQEAYWFLQECKDAMLRKATLT